MTADTQPLTYRVDRAAPLDLGGYESQEGYAAVRRALKEPLVRKARKVSKALRGSTAPMVLMVRPARRDLKDQ